MSELTINQIIKISISIFVLVIVLVGVGFAVYNYIMPFFKGYTFEDKRNLDSSYYQDLMKSENLVAITDASTNTPYIIFKEDNGVKSSYYFTEDRSAIKEDVSWWVDSTVAEIDSSYKIKVLPDYLTKDPRLNDVNNGELIGREIFRVGGLGK